MSASGSTKHAIDFNILSVVIPVYNEFNSWREIFSRVQAADAAGLDKQIVLVDDCSTDGTREQLAKLAAGPGSAVRVGDGSIPAIKVLFHETNGGKGAALRTGYAQADGDIIIVQDADLEYDPGDYPELIRPILDGRADVVYGSRFLGGRPHGAYLKNYLANRMLTWLFNVVAGTHLTDMETCYKVFRRDVLRSIELEQDRFGVEPEVSAKVAGLGVRLVERPIRYVGRTHAEGKKISWHDGIEAVKCIFAYGRPARKRRRARAKADQNAQRRRI